MIGPFAHSPVSDRDNTIEAAAKIGEEHIFNAPDLVFAFNISAKAGIVEAANIPSRKMIEAMDLNPAQTLSAVEAVIENAFNNGHKIEVSRLGDNKTRYAIQPNFRH